MGLTWVLNSLQGDGKGEVCDKRLRSFGYISGIDKVLDENNVEIWSEIWIRPRGNCPSLLRLRNDRYTISFSVKTYVIDVVAQACSA